MKKRSHPKISVTQTPNLEIFGKKIEEGFSSKTPKIEKKIKFETKNSPGFDYTFRETEILEKNTGSGGFKIPFEKFEKNKEEKKSIDFNKSIITKEEVMKKLGIIENKENLKEENYENVLDFEQNNFGTLKNRKEIADDVIIDLEKKIMKLNYNREKLKKKFEEQKQEEIYKNDENNMILYQNFDRTQIISHNLSTNEKPTIENIEALIDAHRNKMRTLELKLKEKKENQMKFLNNSFDGTKQNNNFKTVKFIRPKSSINRNNKFNPEEYKMNFEKYLKKDQTKKSLESKLKIKTKETPRKKKKKFKNTRKEELQLLEFFFEDMPKIEKGKVLKSEIYSYLLKNEKILDLYDIDQNQIEFNLDIFSSKENDRLNFEEFVFFLKNNQTLEGTKFIRPSNSPSPTLKRNLSNKKSNYFLIQKSEINTLKQKFIEIDKHKDYVINLNDFIQKLKKDHDVLKFIGFPAIFLPKYEKYLTLYKVLDLINESEKDYISWSEFLKLITDFDLSLYSKKPLNLENLRTNNQKSHFFSLSNDFLSFIIDIFNNNESNYYLTQQLISEIRNYKRFSFISDSIARIYSSSGSETLNQILRRIEKQADKFIDFQEFIDFFTEEGFPKYFIDNPKEREKIIENRINEFENQNNSPSRSKSNKKFFEKNLSLKKKNISDFSDSKKKIKNSDSKSNKNIKIHSLSNSPKNYINEISEYRVIDGYDSDPEYCLKRSIKSNKSFSPNKKSNITTDFNNKKSIKNLKNKKITIPKPFDFDSRTSKPLKNPIIKEEKFVFKAKEVPEFVKQRNLLEKITQEQEFRREEVKKLSKITTLQNGNPFSFYIRDLKRKAEKKTLNERREYIFKANPVPWFCSVKLLKAMQDEENAKREEKISRNAQISLSKARLPSRMEKHEREKKVFELKYGKNEEFKIKKRTQSLSPKKVPNFHALHKTFQTLLDNKRRAKRPTVAKSPKFNKSKKQANFDFLEQENELLRQEAILKQKLPKTKNFKEKPIFQPSLTKKWEQAVEKGRKEREEKEKKQKRIEEEDKERENKRLKIKERVQNSAAITTNIKELKFKKEKLQNGIKTKIQNDMHKFKEIKKEINDRVNSRPLLVEIATNRDKAFEKMKQLARLNKIMNENGIKNKDIFNKEEQEMIADLEFLKKNNYNIEDLILNKKFNK